MKAKSGMSQARPPRLQLAAVLLAATALVGAPAPHAVAAGTSPGDRRVISYFVEKNVEGHIETEWRILDPASRSDRLFLALGARAVYWDTTESRVDFIRGAQLFEVYWEDAAQPWPLCSLPEGSSATDWWFNPDSLCWQLAEVLGVERQWARGESPYDRCRSTLWQSDHDGGRWHVVAADTEACAGCYFCDRWMVRDSLAVRRQPAVGLARLQSDMTVDGWGGSAEPIPAPKGEPERGPGWTFVPLRSAPHRGVALRVGQRRGGIQTVMAPLYLIDRSTGTQQLLATPGMYRDQELWPIGMEEHDGFLLVSGMRTYVSDLRSGAQLLGQPYAQVRQAVWIKAPAHASVDSLGIRRLRRRFR